jgi:hypothetical protein
LTFLRFWKADVGTGQFVLRQYASDVMVLVAATKAFICDESAWLAVQVISASTLNGAIASRARWPG